MERTLAHVGCPFSVRILIFNLIRLFLNSRDFIIWCFYAVLLTLEFYCGVSRGFGHNIVGLLILLTGNAESSVIAIYMLRCDNNASGFYFKWLNLDIMQIPLLCTVIIIIILTLSGLRGERVLQQMDFIMIRYSFAELLSLEHYLLPDICVQKTLKSCRLLRRPKYLHRGSQQNVHTTGTGIKIVCSRSKDSETQKRSLRGVCHANLCYPQLTHQKMRLETARFAYCLFIFLNVRSLNNKTAVLHDIILNNALDFFCICETWHHPIHILRGHV